MRRARARYRVPTMAEVAATPPNGFKVVSTFSGAGGSTLGYKMAGFDVVWASEFVEAARDTYGANFPDTIVDERDIREVSPEDILEAIGMKPGELDLLDGSPPCASFTMAGKRTDGWGNANKYSDTEQVVDDLFFEYVRLLKVIRPKVFVAENVKGLVTGKAVGYFKQIMAAMRDAGYTVKARVLNAQWLGVPQTRQRLIFVGVRSDLGVAPAHPKPHRRGVTLHEAVGTRNGRPVVDKFWVQAYVVGQRGWARVRRRDPLLLPSPSIMASDGGVSHPLYANPVLNALPNLTLDDEHGANYEELDGYVVRRFSIPELRRVCSFPPDFRLTGPFPKRWERLGRAVPPFMMKAIAETVRDEVLFKCAG